MDARVGEELLPQKEVGPKAKSAFSRFSSWCKSIGSIRIEDLGSDSSTSHECSVCGEASNGHSSNGVLVHLSLFSLSDKPKVHGYGETRNAAMEDACEKAILMLETFEPEIFSLRRKRLRVRLEDFGITLPKTENMLILEGDKEEGIEGLPVPFVDLIKALMPPGDEDDDSPRNASLHIDQAHVDALSLKFLHAIPSIKGDQAEAVFNKIGLSFCDEMNLGMNPTLFAALVVLACRLSLDGVASDEKLKLSFSKVMEQVLIFNAERYPGFTGVIARLIRYFALNRALPFMSRNRLESIGVQWSLGGVDSMKLADVDYLAKANEATLKSVVGAKTPPKEYLDSLFEEFGKINTVIKDLFGIDGAIYGSLVNGFPTSSSDIDVVINLPTPIEETEESMDDDLDEEEEGEGSSKRILAELNRLHDGIKERFGDEFSVSKVESARVPILIVKKGEKIEINLSFNHEVVIHNSALLRAYSSISPKVRELVVLVKHWAKKREINDALQGTLSSYSYVLLVVAFLQQSGLLPDLQNPSESVYPKRPLPQRLTDNGRCSTWFLEDGFEGTVHYSEVFPEYARRLGDKSLTSLVVEFFEFYLYDVNFVTDLVSITTRIPTREDANTFLIREFGNKFVKKHSYFRDRNDGSKLDMRGIRKRTWLAIADPFEVGRVLGTSARGMETLTKEMKRGIEILLNGKAEELFIEYSRKERAQLPPFPARKLDRKDFMEFAPCVFRKEFRMDDIASLEVLVQLVKSLGRKSLEDVNAFKALCYMCKLGMISNNQLLALGLMEKDTVVFTNLHALTKRIADMKSPQVSKPPPVHAIAQVRQELLLHHPDARFHPSEPKGGKGKGKGQTGGKGKGKGSHSPVEQKGGAKGKGKGVKSPPNEQQQSARKKAPEVAVASQMTGRQIGIA
jgi:hypothetical protein